VINPHVDFELNQIGKLDVARAVGTEGHISVVKDLGLRDHFTGQVPIVSGEISEDFTYYFVRSEQIPSAVGAGVLINPDHTVLAAGGFIVQVMPEAEEKTIDYLENQINAFPPISSLIEQGYTPEKLLAKLFGEEEVRIHERLPIQFKCTCSYERVEQTLIGLGADELQAMIEEDKGAEVNCHFCNETYTFTEEDLKRLIES